MSEPEVHHRVAGGEHEVGNAAGTAEAGHARRAIPAGNPLRGAQAIDGGGLNVA